MKTSETALFKSICCSVGAAVFLASATLAASAVTKNDKHNDETKVWNTIVVGKQSDQEQLATVDLQRYIAQVTGKVPVIIDAKDWQKKPRPAVVVGVCGSNPLLKDVRLQKNEVGEQGYYLVNRTMGTNRLVIACGLTSDGAVNAVYGLLRELGFGFYFGSESHPTSIPDYLPKSPVVKKPVFRVRGVLPWYNFFNSPTTWDPIDHRSFTDSLVRMGANFLGFHTYDSEPFAAYPDGGQIKWGSRLLNTSAPTWGTSPLSTDDFGYGTGKLFSHPFFGAKTTFDIADASQAVMAEQDIMRDALDYAKKRGLKTCLGFEMFGDPTDPQYREAFLKRINRLLDKYPTLDFIWLWQAETQGVQGFRQSYNQHILPSTLNPESPLINYGVQRRGTFNRIVERSSGERPFFQDNEEGKAARANEGAKLEQFAMLAYKALSHRKDPPRLVISGWGGDERLLSAEYYDGLDKLLPKDVVFSSLDHIVPRTRVDAAYGDLPKDRERWPIPWLENDGDQWHPQPFVHIYQNMVKDAHSKGSQGILGIHWRSRDIEENLSYMLQYAWEPNLSAQDFFKDYAKRCYDSRIAEEMSQVHTQLDLLGYRWVGGAGQAECAPFGWGPGDPAKAVVLKKIRDRVASLASVCGKGKDRLEWLVGRMDWVLAFQRAEEAAVSARDLISRANTSPDPAQKKELASQALALLDGDAMADALHCYARRVSTRGEYGVLATINTKALVAWRNLRDEAAKLAGSASPDPSRGSWPADPKILLPRFIGSTEERKDLELYPVVMGGGSAWVHYRNVGKLVWKSVKLQTVEGWVYTTAIAAKDVSRPGLEIGFSFSPDPGKPMAYGPVVVTVMPPTKTVTTPRPVMSLVGDANLNPSVREGQSFPIEVIWNDLPDALYYKVFRNGNLVVETSVNIWPDSPTEATGTYIIEAWRDGNLLARSSEVKYTVPDRPITEVFTLEAHSNNASVLLTWPAAKTLYITSYQIARSRLGESSKVISLVPASKTTTHRFRDVTEAGTWTYSVTPMNATGGSGQPSSVTLDFQPGQTVAPAIDLPLTYVPGGVNITGNVSFSESGAAFNGGYLNLPHQNVMNMGFGMTLTFGFKANQINGMPVMLSHGLWQIDGWYVQILGGKFVVHTPTGDIWGPVVETDRWYSVRFVFDGVKLLLAIDGEWIPQEQTLVRDLPAVRNLVIGQYENVEAQFAFQGSLRNLKIYNAVVLN